MITDNEKLRELASLPAGAGPREDEQGTPERATRPVLVFRVGSRIFGTEAHHVYEVVVSGSLTPVPTARSFVLGITLVRGRLVPVVSLGELLGFPSGGDAAPTLPRLLILREGPLEVAVMVDATLGIYDLDVTDVGATGGARPDCIAGEVEFRGKLLFLLSVPELLGAVTGDKGAR